MRAAPAVLVAPKEHSTVGWGVERERARDADAAFGEFVDAASPALTRIAWVLVLDAEEARDMVQEALARTYVHWARIWRSGEDPLPYVRRVLVNMRTDRWRKHARRLRAETLWAARTGVPTEDAPDEVDESASLAVLPSGLADRQRQVVALRYLQDLSVEETAAILDLSRAAVKMAASRALTHLRQRVEEEER